METTVVHKTKIYQFKAKDYEKSTYPLCLDNIAKDFVIDTTNVLDIHRYLLKEV